MIAKNCDIQTLMNKIKSDKLKLVCFGAGAYLREACNLFESFDFFDNIYSIIDNNPRKFSWREHSKDVFTPDKFLKSMNDDNLVMYISSSYYVEMFEQLNALLQTESVECYIHSFVLHMPLSYDFKECQTSDIPLIPKKIHYCWFGGKEIPKQNRIWMESWDKYCPDYEIIRWDESNYDVSKHHYMYEAYKQKRWAFVSDYARLDIVLNQGGVYLDNDVELLKSLDSLLFNKCFLGIVKPGLINTGLGFGSVADFPFLRLMRDYYDNYTFKFDYAWDNGTFQSMFASEHGFTNLNKPQQIKEAIMLPTDILSPIDWNKNPVAFTENTYAIHHFEASWFESKQFDKRTCELLRFKEFYDSHFGKFTTSKYKRIEDFVMNKNNKKIIVFGAGAIGRKYVADCPKEVEIIAIVDNNYKNCNPIYGRLPISPNEIPKLQYDDIVITIDEHSENGHKNIFEILRQLIDMGVLSDNITLLSPNCGQEIMVESPRMEFLRNLADDFYERKISGSVAECGVCYGDFASKINKVFPDKTLWLFDTFEFFDERDLKMEEQQLSDTIRTLNKTCTACDTKLVLFKMTHKSNVIINKGFVPDTFVNVPLDEKFCFVNLDMDLYAPTLAGLRFFADKMVDGGVILVHDCYCRDVNYELLYKGIKKAIDEFAKEQDFIRLPVGDACSCAIILK